MDQGETHTQQSGLEWLLDNYEPQMRILCNALQMTLAIDHKKASAEVPFGPVRIKIYSAPKDEETEPHVDSSF